MSNNRLAVQAQPFTLFGSGAVIGDTSLTLTNFNGINGTALTMANFGTKGYGTIEPGSSSQEEQISFTGVTANANGTVTLTGVSTVLFISPYTETSGLAKSHAGATRFVISNTSAFYSGYTNKNDDETVAGTWTFNNKLGVGAVTSADLGKACTVDLLNSTAIAGAPNAATNVKGIVQISTDAQNSAGTSVGSTGALLVPNSSGLSATSYYQLTTTPNGTDTYVATCRPTLTAYADGTVFLFTPDVANTGAATLNVDGLGAKSITKFGAALKTNDLTAGHMQWLAYESSSNSFRLLSLGGRTLQGQDGQETQGSCTNIANAYTVTCTPAYPALVTGMVVRFIASATNSGAATLAVDGLTAKAIVLSPSTALVGGEIVNGAEVEATYDGTNFQMAVVPAGLIAGIGTPLTTLHAHKQVGFTGTRTTGPDGAVTYAHGLGATPNWVRISYTVTGVASGSGFYSSVSGNNCHWGGSSGGAFGGVSSTYTVVYQDSNGSEQGAVTVDATNVTITWTKISTPNAITMNMLFNVGV